MGIENIWLVALGGLSSLVASVLYMMGGTDRMGGKWVRRYISPLFITAFVVFSSLYLNVFDWKYFLFYPILVIGFSLPYGSDTTFGKVIKRSIFAITCLFANIVGLIIAGISAINVVLLVVAFLIGLVSVFLGAKNPFKNAPLEQYLICQCLTFIMVWWPFTTGG